MPEDNETKTVMIVAMLLTGLWIWILINKLLLQT